MAAPTLREIEKTVVTLFLDRPSRESFLKPERSRKRKKATAIDAVPQELLNEVDRRGVDLYARLLSIGHHDVIDSIYPGCSRLIGEKWDEVVDNYLEKYPPSHYNFNRTAVNFAAYLEKHGERFTRKFPYLPELADYEWLELEILEKNVKIEAAPYESLVSPEQFDRLGPIVNPALAIRHYAYPITSIVDHLSDGCCLPSRVEPEATIVAVYRDPEDHSSRFLEVGRLAAQVVEHASRQVSSYAELIGLVVALSPDKDPQESVLGFLELVEELQEKRLLVGSRQIP